MDKFLWVERHRPKTIEQCILSDTIKGTLEDLVRDNKVPNLMFPSQRFEANASKLRFLS